MAPNVEHKHNREKEFSIEINNDDSENDVNIAMVINDASNTEIFDKYDRIERSLLN